MVSTHFKIGRNNCRQPGSSIVANQQMVRNNQINLNRAEHLEGVFGVGCGKNLVPRTFEDSFANEESARFIVNAQN